METEFEIKGIDDWKADCVVSELQLDKNCCHFSEEEEKHPHKNFLLAILGGKLFMARIAYHFSSAPH